MGDLTKDFSRKEFRCRCGRRDCDAASIDMKLAAALQALRDLIGVPIIINSALRCVRHNRRVGGVRNSRHLEGIAADVYCPELSPAEFAKFAAMIPEFDNGGIGIYDWGIHVDVRGRRARWDYRRRK